MKRLLVSMALISLFVSLFAQSKVHVHRSDAVDIKLFTSVLDSITFQKPEDEPTEYSSLTIHKKDASSQVLSLQVVDSIEFGEDKSEYIFDISALPEIRLNVKLKDWNALLSYYDINNSNEECVPASIEFKKNGVVTQLDSIGIRIRGNTSRRRPEGYEGQPHNPTFTDWNHAHFGLKFAEYRKGQSMFNTDRFNLKWFKDDAMYCREIYCYDLFKRFGVWTAPRASYARLTIYVEGDAKPAYYGVYSIIEAINDDYLKYRVLQGKFSDDKGNLWKAGYGADLSEIQDYQMGVENITLNPSTMQTYVYDLKTNKKSGLATAKVQLKSFIDQMSPLPSGSAELKAYLEQKMDVDLFLRAYAVNVMVGMWDDYWYNKNNFYFYFDTNGKFYFIPYDYDNTLGTSIGMNSGTQDMLNWGSLDGSRMLMRKVMSITEFKETYMAYIKELANANNNLFDTDKSIARIQQWHAMIGNFIVNDTYEDMLIEDKPASWGNADFYRLFTGNDKGGVGRNAGDANFFKTKIKSITW
jgi:spore coat protein H